MDRDLNIKPLVTVILPTFNRLTWLLKSIDSVLKQTFTNWELFVIDDASSDGTTEKMQELAKSDSRIIYHKLPVTKEPGIAKFLNFGINNANGKYIARIDDDDQWCNENKLQLQLDFFEKNPEYVLIGGGVIVIDENEKEIYRYFENETDREIRKKILYANPMSHPTVMFKRETALKIGGYLILEFAEDWDFFLRMGKEGKMHNFKEYFAHYLMAQQNNSLRNQRGLAKAILKLIKTHKYDYTNYSIGYIINYFQYLHSFFPKAFRRETTNYLKYLKESISNMNYFIAGGAGFIGSHLVRKILLEEKDSNVRVYDNFSSGQMWHLDEVVNDKRLEIVKGDIKDIDLLVLSMKGIDCVYHFASNPDISKAATQPDIDFWEGTYLTNNVLEAIRRNNVPKLIYASGSGVYGDTGYTEADEDYAPMVPVSTYGASKLAGEALISSYCFMFDLKAAAFRFANVVGPNQTHGVGYDFLNRLMKNPNELDILGNGTQSKSYIYVYDVLNAIRLVEKNFLNGFSYFNVATTDYITVKEIAEVILEVMKLNDVKLNFGDSDRGWKGDVPIVRLNSDKIRNLGWTNKFNAREAIFNSVSEMYNKINNI